MRTRRPIIVFIIIAALVLVLALVVVLVSLLKIQQVAINHAQPTYQAKELYSKAVDQIDHGSYATAEDYLKQALTKEDEATYRNQLAVVEYRLKKYPEAIAQYTTLVTAKQDLGFSYNGIGNAYRDWGNHVAQAEAAYNQAITADPQYIAAYSNLALLQNTEGNKAAALKTLEAGIAANPQSADELRSIEKTLQAS